MRTAEKRVTKFDPEDWEAWAAHLAGRKTPRDPWRTIGTKSVWPLIWALDHTSVPADTRELIARIARWCEHPGKSRTATLVKQLERWLADSPSRRNDLATGLEALAWSYILPRLAETLPASTWHEVLGLLIDLATNWPELDLQSQPLAHQWLAGELPWTLAYQFPELSVCQRLGEPAVKALSRGLKELLDSNGLPAAQHVSFVRPLLACWTRCLALHGDKTPPLFDASASSYFEWFVRRALQLTRQTGCPVFSGVSTGSDDRELFETAIELVGDEEDLLIANQILPSRVNYRRKNRQQGILAEPSANSEWGQLAVFRPDWSRGCIQLVVARLGGTMHTELDCGTETVWNGPWTQQIRIDGRVLAQPQQWDEVCWHSDDDVDFQELQANLSDGWVLQRQILLAREDHFLYLADALLGPNEAEIEYQAELPLAAGVRFDPMDETHEGTLMGNRCLGTVLPLALPEWRISSSNGAVQSFDNRLQIRHAAQSQRLYVPLFLDLDRSRFRRPLTWRRLTVAERLQIQPPSQVVAYRVQVGDEQWLFYRSLGPAANRTVLGENLSNEFLAARFDQDGDSDDLIRIDME
jgi:hypothetical protein